jgi:drug/metabolite transporter (DMT)-like permease
VNPPGARHYGLALAGALGLSTTPILVALSRAEPAPVAFFRFAYALPGLLALCLLRADGRRALRTSGWRLAAALAGAFLGVDLLLWHRSIALIGAGPATLAANTQVIWVALFGIAFLRERPHALFWASLPAVALGLVLLVGGTLALPAGRAGLGLAFGLGAGLCYAGALVCLRRSQRAARVPPEASLLAQIGVGLAVVGAAGLAERSLPVSLTPEQHGWLALLGVGAQVGAWLLITAGIRALPGHVGALLLLVQPVGALVLGWWILGQALTLERAAGALLVVVGIAAAVLSEPRASASAPGAAG